MPGRDMRVRLTDERRARMLAALKTFFAQTLDQELSDFNAGRVLDFFVRELGPPVYNQAVQDARAFVAEKLDDLDAELYEPER